MSRNQQNQIDELNAITKATAGVSRVHGVGVLAIRDLKKGEKLHLNKLPQIYNLPYASLSKLFPEVRKIILDRWPNTVNGSLFVFPDIRLSSLLNHSEDDNYEPKTDTAKRDIKKGEEVLINYKEMPNFEKVWPPKENLWLHVSKTAEQQSEKNTLGVRNVMSPIRNLLKSWTPVR